jgi:MFS family permease
MLPMTHALSLAVPVTDETSPRYRGWRVTLVCFVMATFCWGFGFYGHGFYLAELQRLHHWPAALISGASTAYYFFSAILVVFVNDVIVRLGLRAFVLGGVACLAGSAILLTIVTAPWQLFAVYLLMSFGWAAMSVGAITNILGLWFERKRGLAISLALTGASFAGIAIVPPLVLLAGQVGFAAAMMIATAVMLVVLVPLTLAWIDDAPAERDVRNDAGPTSAPARTWTRAKALRDVGFWTVSAPFALALMAQVGFLVHQIALLEPSLGRAQAGVAVAVTTAMAIVGRLGAGAFIDRIDQRKATAVSVGSQAAALFVMTQTNDPTWLIAACAVFGLSVGHLVTFPALIIQREFEPQSFGLLIGLSTAISQFTYAFGPGVLGVLRDLTGGYTASLALCVALDVAAAVIILLRPRHGL